MKHKSNEQTLGEVIADLLRQYRLKDGLDAVKLVDSWEKVVGSSISRHTVNLYVKRRKLFVKLDSAALREELSYSKSKLIYLLNQEAGEEVIDEIIFN